MNAKKVKKIRKGTKHSFILFLRERPKWLPKWFWRLCAITIFNSDGIEVVGALYGFKKTIKHNGVRYKIKK